MSPWRLMPLLSYGMSETWEQYSCHTLLFSFFNIIYMLYNIYICIYLSCVFFHCTFLIYLDNLIWRTEITTVCVTEKILLFCECTCTRSRWNFKDTSQNENGYDKPTGVPLTSSQFTVGWSSPQQRRGLQCWECTRLCILCFGNLGTC